MALLTDYITYYRGKSIEATSRTVVIADYFGMIGVGAVLKGPWLDWNVALCRRKMIAAASCPSGEVARWVALIALGVGVTTYPAHHRPLLARSAKPINRQVGFGVPV